MGSDSTALKDKAAANESPPVAVSGAALSESEKRAFKKTLWRERMFSLWAPVTTFGAIFALYIVLIELNTASYHFAQPVMKVIGLLALGSFVLLLAARNLLKPFGRLRTSRHFVYEVLGELRQGLANQAISKENRVIGEQSEAALMRLYVEGHPDDLAKQGESVSKFVEKDLGRKRFGADFVLGFVKAFAIAMAIRTLIIEPFKIPSGSMIPTLEIGDQIFVNKFIYGVRIPYLNKVPFQIVRAPDRGDVIVFNNPLQEDKDFVKRIIGIGGDQIVIDDDTITINGVVQERTLQASHYKYMDQAGAAGWTENNWSSGVAVLFQENLAGKPHPILQTPQITCGTTFNAGQPFTVPEGTVFVMGDNRDNSSDGRYGLGTAPSCSERITFVPRGHIKGKAMVVWLALGFEGIGHKLFGGTGFRTDRLFKPVR